MSLVTTLVILALAVTIVGLAVFASRRRRTPGDVSLVPYVAIQFVGLVIIVLMLAHLVSLLTGEPFQGRAPF